MELNRTLSLPLITFYGLGTILGAGIYVLVGKVADTAGMYAPAAFALAALTAGLSAFVYMELCSRYPLSGGAAVYTQEGPFPYGCLVPASFRQSFCLDFRSTASCFENSARRGGTMKPENSTMLRGI